VIEAFAAEAERIYGAVRVKLDEKTQMLVSKSARSG